MRLLFGCCVAGFFLLLCSSVRSQSKFSGVKGRLVLQNDIIAEVAAVILIRLRDSSIAGQATVKPTGDFEFDNITPGDYVVRITYTGYVKYVSTPFAVGNKQVILQPVTMLPYPTMLKGVTITNKKNYIETHSDRTILNVEKSIIASGVSVLDVLNTAPGVRVNSDGVILFKGGQRAAIAINGRVVNLSPQDIAAQLQNMQSSNISQVELMDNPPAKYDASGAGGLINLIIKKGQDEGFNMGITEMAGYGNFYKVGTGFNANYRTKSFNFFGSYNLGNNNTDHTIITSRDIGSDVNFNVGYYNRQKSYANGYTFGLDYSMDSAHTLGVFVIGYFNNYFLNKDTRSAIANKGVLDSTLITTSALNRRMGNADYTLSYNGKLGKTNQSLSADVDYFNFNRTSNEDLMSSLWNNHTGTFGGVQYFTNHAPTRISNLSGQVDYTNPLTKSSKLEAGIKFIFAASTNNQQFDNVANGIHTANTAVGSEFKYTENVSSAYATYTATLSAKFNYMLSLRAEHTESDANTVTETYRIRRSYTDLLPNVSFNFTLNRGNQLSLTYNRRIDRPDYQELNPIIAYQDRYNLTSGNAYLRPSYTDKVELKHTYQDKLVTSFYASFIRDANNFTYFSQNDATGVFTAGKMNLRLVTAYGVNMTIPFEVVRWWDVNLSVDMSYIRYQDYAGKLNKGTADGVFKLTQQFQLPAGLSLDIYGFYEMPNFYYIYQYKASYYITTGIQKSLLNRMATLTLKAEDLFNTNRDRYSTNYNNLNLTGYDKKEMHIYRLTFAYKFGKGMASRKHVSGNSDDVKRLDSN